MFFHPRHVITALAFLTRLLPGRVIDDTDFAPSVAWFPLAGLVVGGLAVTPAALGLFAATPALAGWLAVGISLWLTRGLHADGLCDLADAWGSCATGARFWEIMKDSRVGAFGVIALVMALGGQGLAFGVLIERGQFIALALCFMLGRLGAATLLALGRSQHRPGLAALFIPGATPAALAFGLAQVAAVALLALAMGQTMLGPWRFVAAVAANLVVVLALARLARRHGGPNGDFIGAAVVLGELSAALAMAA